MQLVAGCVNGCCKGHISV